MWLRRGGSSVGNQEEKRKRFRSAFRAHQWEEVKKLVVEDPTLCLLSLHHHTLLMPLHDALMNCEVDMVEFLLDHGADPLLPDTEGLQAIHYACLSGI